MPVPYILGLAGLALRARMVGGIKGVKTVSKDFAEGMAPPIAPKTQAQINAEGLKKIRDVLNLPKKGTPAYSRYLAKQAKNNTVTSEKAGKAFTKTSKKTYKN